MSGPGYPTSYKDPLYLPSTGLPYNATVTTQGAPTAADSTAIAQMAKDGLPASTSIGNLQQWEEQEINRTALMTGHAGDPLAGIGFAPGEVGSFLGMISTVESYMANVGYNLKYMPSAFQMLTALRNLPMGDTAGLYKYFSDATGAAATMPWAAYGMSSDQYNKSVDSLNQSVYGVTGQSDWAAAGLDQGTLRTALLNGWSTTQIQDMIAKNPGLNSQYNWAKYGVSYQQLQSSKASSHAALAAQYGGNYTDQQAANALYVNPLQAFGASGQAVTSQSGSSGSSGGSGSAASQSGQLGHAARVR
jgi:hypothetical protein